ncbi:MAG TPA: endolytic transglycosylase MltG, partial [Candidatus Peribacteraceae bacterium]|nr:endolytic transglycosylase MltG [Candidatus Peribacteraceae bacterium]
QSSMDTPAIIGALKGGKTQQEVITIPEGYTVEDIDALLAKKGLIQPGDLVHCAQTCDFSSFAFLPKDTADLAPRGGKVEGYLYPDTYYVETDNFVPKFFIERLLSTFKAKVLDPDAADIKASGRSANDIVTMASLIEKETRNADERPTVSGILWKRLDQHMTLGVDAAVRYVLDRGNQPITASDLQVESPYNLRKEQGLPPGPIASPSLSSIEAALHPQASPYFYYLHDSNGNIHYAVTNDEQNANRAKYLQ